MTDRQEHLLQLLTDQCNSSARMGRGDHEAIQAAIDEIVSLTARLAAVVNERNGERARADECGRLNLDARRAWRTEPPSIPKGEAVSVIVAKFSEYTNRHYVFGAWYLNEFPIDDGEEGPALWTGFHEASRYADYDGCYAPLVGVTHWMPMPAGPIFEPAQPGAVGESRSVEAENSNVRYVLTSAWSELRQWESLARRQREMMDQNPGWCPTQAGIDASVAVRGRISSVLACLTMSEPREE